MSIIRVGLAETKNFSEGYDLIFGKQEPKPEEQKKDADQPATKDETKEPEKK